MSKWPVKKLEEVCEIIMGQSPKGDTYNDQGEGMPLINGPVEFGEGAFSKTVQTKFTTEPTKLCKKNDLILCVRGSTTGKMNIAGSDACIGRGVAAIRAKGSQDWVNHFINFKREDIYNLGSGSTFPNVSGATLKKIPIPVPPLAEQERIVAVLDQAFEAIAAATAHTQQKLHHTQELFQSTLQSAFSRNDECGMLNEKWVETTIGDLVKQGVLEKPLDGNHGEIHPKKADFVETGVPFLMASDLRKDGTVDCETCNFISRAQAETLRKGFAENGDILISHKGTIGRVARLETSLDYVMLTPQITYYRVNEKSVLHPDYIYCYFKSPEFQNAMCETAGAGSTRAYIGITKQLELPFSYPTSLPTQRAIVAKLDALSAETRRLESLYQRQLHAYTELKSSLLHQAFSGML